MIDFRERCGIELQNQTILVDSLFGRAQPQTGLNCVLNGSFPLCLLTFFKISHLHLPQARFLGSYCLSNDHLLSFVLSASGCCQCCASSRPQRWSWASVLCFHYTQDWERCFSRSTLLMQVIWFICKTFYFKESGSLALLIRHTLICGQPQTKMLMASIGRHHSC